MSRGSKHHITSSMPNVFSHQLILPYLQKDINTRSNTPTHKNHNRKLIIMIKALIKLITYINYAL